MKLFIKVARAMTEAIIMILTRTRPDESVRSIEPDSGFINSSTTPVATGIRAVTEGSSDARYPQSPKAIRTNAGRFARNDAENTLYPW